MVAFGITADARAMVGVRGVTLEAGWKFHGYNMHQRSMQAEEDEVELIQAALDKLERFTGQGTHSWLSRGLKETGYTPDLLKAVGIGYLRD